MSRHNVPNYKTPHRDWDFVFRSSARVMPCVSAARRFNTLLPGCRSASPMRVLVCSAGPVLSNNSHNHSAPTIYRLGRQPYSRKPTNPILAELPSIACHSAVNSTGPSTPVHYTAPPHSHTSEGMPCTPVVVPWFVLPPRAGKSPLFPPWSAVLNYSTAKK